MKYLLAALFLVQSAMVFGQYQIKKAWVFSEVRNPGMIPKMQPGMPQVGPTTIYLCFVEVAKDARTADWQSVSIKGNKYAVTAVAVKEDSVFVGTEKTTKAPIWLKPTAGNKLIKLEQTPTNEAAAADTCIFLEGVADKKRMTFKYDQPIIQLSPVLMP
jgi:hypothetical protein